MSRTSGYDYVIVGGGSSACVVARRLVDAGARTLIIERGKRRGSRLLAYPAGYMKFLARDDYLAMHPTVPQPQLGGRAPIVPQARLLGGGSAVNAMVYMRGTRADFDDWDAMLAAPGSNGAGWGYADLLPYFKAQEDNDHLAGAYHGVGGPLKVSHLGHTSPMTRSYVKTMQALGVPFNPDFNGAEQAGVGFMQHTIDWRTRTRCDAVTAFLGPILNDPRLTIATEASVTRIVIEAGRARGVTYVEAGETRTALAEREVILAAGTYQTPKLLMLSGIGPAAKLGAHGIAVVADLPGVGANLQDHHEVPVVARTNGAYGYYGHDRGLKMLRHGLQYLLFRSGPVATTGVETCAFIDPRGNTARPTIQLFCVPTIYLDRDIKGAERGDGVTLNALVLRPKARGRVALASTDPLAPPTVDPRYFADPGDLDLSIEGLHFARRVLATAPIKDLVAREILPGPGITSDSDLAGHCRRTVKTSYHPVGTCRMGRDGDPMAVLDIDLRVRGIEGLRVVDASIMPTIPSGNTNAAVLAVAAKAGDIIAAAAGAGDRRAA